MNRLHHLKETLPMNVADNATTENIEFVILDYNSTDGLEAWMQQKFDIFCGKVVYFKTTQPTFYNRSHSRNMAFRLASGDVVCNLEPITIQEKASPSTLRLCFSSTILFL